MDRISWPNEEAGGFRAHGTSGRAQPAAAAREEKQRIWKRLLRVEEQEPQEPLECDGCLEEKKEKPVAQVYSSGLHSCPGPNG